MAEEPTTSPDLAATRSARTIALQMIQERGRGAVLVGVARVDAALEHLLQALMAPAPNRGDGLFLPDRPLGSLGAKVALARRLGLIDAPVERALSALRKLRNAFAHSTESASLADPAHSARLAEIYAEARTNPLWAPLETVLAAQPPSAHGPLEDDGDDKKLKTRKMPPASTQPFWLLGSWRQCADSIAGHNDQL